MDPADESPVTQLFDEYRRARDEGRDVDLGRLLERAGSARRELEGRVQVFEQLASLSKDFKAKIEERQRPEKLGRFRIQRALGKGGLSRVYLAFDPKLARTVALKVLDRSFLQDAAERLWILNEARSLARLAHPGVVQVFDVGEADGFDFVEMEHLTGPTLGQVVRALRSLGGGAISPISPISPGSPGSPGSPASPAPETLAVARELQGMEARLRLLHRLASALAYCHNRGVIHRDIKPDNVVLDRDGKPKLVDFGLAHQDSEGTQERPAITEAFIGTRAYLAPEQIEGKRTGADPRSDQFSFATLAYELLSLTHPFAGASDAETEAAVRRADPERLRRHAPGVPRELEVAIHHALARLPDGRYPNVQALADDLRAILEHRPISIAPPSLGRRAMLFSRRHRAQVLLAAAALAGTVAVGGSFWASSAIRERLRIEQGLGALDVAACRTPSEFSRAAQKLITLLDTAKVCDAHLYCRVLARPLLEDVRAKTHAWSRHLGEAFAGSNGEEQEGAWRLLFELDEALCPELTSNQAVRDRGRVFLPLAELEGREWRLLRMKLTDPPCHIVDFEEVRAVDRLPPGTYCLQAWEKGAERLDAELSFVIAEEWGAARSIELRRPDPLLHERSIAFPRTEITRSAGPRTVTVSVPAFRIVPEPVTQDEFLRFVEATGHRPGPSPSRRNGSDAAWVDLDSATLYASWVGGRLPSNEEVWIAGRAGALILDQLPFPTPRVMTNEWVRNLEPSAQGCYSLHRILEDPVVSVIGLNPGTRDHPRTEAVEEDTKRLVGTGFRVAFSDEIVEID